MLGEALAAFELRGGIVRAEGGESGSPQRIGDAVDQRTFRADHDQTDAPCLAERDDGGVIGDIQRDQFGMLRDPRIARRGEQFLTKPGLRQLPCQRMFAPARSQQQDVHVADVALRR